jgi:hypothetical protein
VTTQSEAGRLRYFARAGVTRAALVEASLVAIGATALVCGLFWPAVVHMSSVVIGGRADATGTVFSIWQWQQEGYHLFGITHHTLTGAPFGWDADNVLNIQWLIPYYPAYLAAKLIGPVASENLVLLTGYVLSGVSMYALVRYLGCGRLVAAWAGAVYVIFPSHIERTPQPSLVHIEFLPLLLMALIAAARHPSRSRFLLVGAVTLACWLTSGYYGAMAVITTVAFGLAGAFVAGEGRRRRFFAGTVGSAVAATMVVAALTALSAIGTAGSVRSGVLRPASDLRLFGFHPLELLLPSGDSVVFGHWLQSFWASRQHGSGHNETNNDVGLLTLGLALVWLLVAWRGRRALDMRTRVATIGLLAVVAAAVVFGLPSPIAIFGHDVWMPSRLLFEFVSPFRVPSRWIAMVMTALLPLAALGLQEGWTKVAARTRNVRTTRFAPVALVLLAMVVSVLELSVSPTAAKVYVDRLPPEYSVLARTRFGVLADYPLVLNENLLFWQRLHHRPFLNSEATGTPADDARRVVLDPEAPGTAAKLAFLGVTAIVTHGGMLSETASNPDLQNAHLGAGYSLLARSEDGSSAWKVIASPAPVLVTLPSGFGDPLTKGRRIEFPIVSSTGVASFDIRAKQPGVVRLAFDAEAPPGERTRLLMADGDRELRFALELRTRIVVRVQVPSGLSALVVRAERPATSTSGAIRMTAPNATRALAPAQLHAGLLSRDLGF